MTISNPKKKSPTIISKLATAKNINYTPVLTILVLVLQMVAILQLLVQGSLLAKSNSEPPSRFVELADGRSVQANSLSSRDRSDEVIDKFTRDMMEFLFSASNSIIDPQGNSLPDPGISINDRDVTERSALALLFVEAEFFPLLLEDISEANSPEVFEGKATRVLKIRHLTPPRAIEEQPGHWELQMIGNLYSYHKSKQKLFVSKFNKKIQLKAIDRPSQNYQSLFQDLSQEMTSLMDKPYYQQIFSELSNAGLEITLISTL